MGSSPAPPACTKATQTDGKYHVSSSLNLAYAATISVLESKSPKPKSSKKNKNNNDLMLMIDDIDDSKEKNIKNP